MLDAKELRTNLADTEQKLAKRGDFNLSAFTSLDEEYRLLLQEKESLKARQNNVSKNIPLLKAKGESTTVILAQMKELSEEIDVLENKTGVLEKAIKNFLMTIPNIPHQSVPEGKDDSANVELRKFGEIPSFDFEYLPHYELGTKLGILDFEASAKVTGSRFVFYKGLGAKLERALITLMLDTHVNLHGYLEVLPPVIINRNSMEGTGMLPKFEEDAFKLTDTDYFLAPTAEVPVTNIHKNEILKGSDLPIKYCAYSPCFRAEAGSAGRDTRGLVRLHQFNKVELVKFTKPEDSYEALESLTADAEKILQLLKLPYRVVRLCGGDLGFSSAMTYDIEVWMPSYNRYVEISSCSNFETFQARRANIRYKNNPTEKAAFVHTLNGSGLAVGRLFAAILENFQEKDGTINLPDILFKYMDTKKIEVF